MKRREKIREGIKFFFECSFKILFAPFKLIYSILSAGVKFIRSWKIIKAISSTLNKLTNLLFLSFLTSTSFFVLFLVLNTLLHRSNSQNFVGLQNFTDWLGIPYGVLTSMILVRVWEKVDNFASSLEHEASKVAFLLNTIESSEYKIKANTKKNILFLVNEYVQHIQRNYSGEYKSVEQKKSGDEILRYIENEVNRNSTSPKRNLHSIKVLEAIKDLTESRNNRLTNYQPLSSYMWVLLLATSFLWVITFLFVDFQGNYWGYAMVYGIMFIAVTTIVTITNFNDPTKLEWDDLSGSWEAIRIKIEIHNKGYPDEKQAESK